MPKNGLVMWLFGCVQLPVGVVGGEVYRNAGDRKQKLADRLSNTKSSKFSYRSHWSDSHTIRGIGMRDKKPLFEITNRINNLS